MPIVRRRTQIKRIVAGRTVRAQFAVGICRNVVRCAASHSDLLARHIGVSASADGSAVDLKIGAAGAEVTAAAQVKFGDVPGVPVVSRGTQTVDRGTACHDLKRSAIETDKSVVSDIADSDALAPHLSKRIRDIAQIPVYGGRRPDAVIACVEDKRMGTNAIPAGQLDLRTGKNIGIAVIPGAVPANTNNGILSILVTVGVGVLGRFGL